MTDIDGPPPRSQGTDGVAAPAERIGLEACAPFSLIVEDLSKVYSLGTRPLRLGSLRKAWAGLFGQREEGAAPRERGEIWALKNVSFSVKPGTILGIIGPNGAGKTTLLKVIARVTPPTAGRVIGRGRVVSLLELGLGFQPDLSATENVFLNAAIHGIPRSEAEKRLEDIIEFAELRDFVDLPVSRFSSGMYLRLAFSVAIHMDPSILLADEVLAVGDIGFQERCLQRAASEKNTGKTILFVSHDMAAIRRLCDEVVWLTQGQVVGRGGAEEIVARYEESMWQPRFHALGDVGGHVNEDARIISVGLRSGAGAEIGSVRVSEDFYLRITFEVKAPNVVVRPAFDLYSQDILVLRTWLEDYSVDTPGVYAAAARIPRLLLADTRYWANVSVRVFRGTASSVVKQYHAVAFQVYDDVAAQGGRGADRGIAGRGVVSPPLVWSCSPVPEAAALPGADGQLKLRS